jgi:hypothetical protein
MCATKLIIIFSPNKYFANIEFANSILICTIKKQQQVKMPIFQLTHMFRSKASVGLRKHSTQITVFWKIGDFITM